MQKNTIELVIKAVDKASKIINDVNKKTKKSMTVLQSGFSKTAPYIAGSAAVISTAIAGIGAASIAMASDVEKSTAKLQAQLGITATEAEEVADVAKNIFKNAWGDSINTVMQNVSLLKRNLGEIPVDSLENLTKQAMIIEETFGASIDETMKTVKLMTTAFEGLSESDAFDLITIGFQKGGDYAKDLLDTLWEYSPQFAKIGMSADEMMGILIKGAEAGAFNLDKVGDAVKEFSIRAVDGTKTTAKGFEILNMNAEEMAMKIAQGGETAEQAFMAVVTALASLNDPLERETAGLALFGTQWEDLSGKVITAMAEGKKAVTDFTGATEKAGKVMHDNLISKWETVKRTIMLCMTDAVQPLMGHLNELLTWINGNMPQIQAVIVTTFNAINTSISFLSTNIIPPLIKGLQWVYENFNIIGPAIAAMVATVIIPAFISWATAAASAAAATITALLPVIATAAAVGAAVALLAYLWQKHGEEIKLKVQEIVSWIIQKWDEFVIGTKERWNMLMNFLRDWWPLLLTVITGPVVAIVTAVIKNWDTIKQKTFEIWDLILNKITVIFQNIQNKVNQTWNTIKEGIVRKLNNIKQNIIDKFNNILRIFDGLKSKFYQYGKMLMNKLSSGITSGLNSIRAQVNKAKSLLNRLNPFSRNSPSLVDLVQKGTKLIAREYGELSNLKIQQPELQEFSINKNNNTNEGRSEKITIQGPLISINNMNVREETDIEKIAIELQKLVNEKIRNQGFVTI